MRLGLIAIPVSAAIAGAQASTNCNAPTPEPVVHVAVPGNPFTPQITADGCWIFVAMTGNPAQGGSPGVAVVRRSAGALTLTHTVPLKAGGTGSALTHDGKVLVVAAGTTIAFLDAEKLKSPSADPLLGYLDVPPPPNGPAAGVIYASTTRDDALAFVALERAFAVLVIDLKRVRAGTMDTTAIIGRIPTGNAPIAVTLSPDDKHLYVTSQAQAPGWNWPNECKPEGQDPATSQPNHSQGAVLVVDVAKARADAANSVVKRFPVGCNPVRLVVTPDGGTAWVSTRGDHAIVALDTKKLLTDSANAVVKRLPVGTAPVGVAVVDDGRRVIATNSNRFAGSESDVQSLNIVDASRGPANATILGTIPAGAFPRELRVSPDGKTLYASNFASKTLQVIDLSRIAPAKQ